MGVSGLECKAAAKILSLNNKIKLVTYNSESFIKVTDPWIKL